MQVTVWQAKSFLDMMAWPQVRARGFHVVCVSIAASTVGQVVSGMGADGSPGCAQEESCRLRLVGALASCSAMGAGIRRSVDNSGAAEHSMPVAGLVAAGAMGAGCSFASGLRTMFWLLDACDPPPPPRPSVLPPGGAASLPPLPLPPTWITSST